MGELICHFPCRDVPSFGLYMVIYEVFIRNVHDGPESTASPRDLIVSGGMAGKSLLLHESRRLTQRVHWFEECGIHRYFVIEHFVNEQDYLLVM